MKIKKDSKRSNFRDNKTKRLNIDYYINSSGLQKSTRRGEIDYAMIYCREFVEAGLYNYLWKRIFIYLVEDIGLGNLYLGEIILKLYKNFKKTETEDYFEADYIYQAIYLLALSPKNRENDCMISLIKKFNIGIEADKEFIKKFCTEDYYKSSSKKIITKISTLLDNEFKNSMNSKLYNIYKECFHILWDLKGGDGIYLYVVNFYLIKKYGIGYNYYSNGNNKWFENIKSSLHNGKFNFIELSKFKIEEYVYDKHTYKGKFYYKRGFKHFFEEGGYLVNEIDVNGNQYKKEIFQLIKGGIITN